MKRVAETVVHVPRTISCVCTLFLRQRGSISYEVTGSSNQLRRRLIAILVTHDVIDWLELCTCPFTVTFKYSRTKYSRMAADPRKPRTLTRAKIKAHTVFLAYILSPYVMYRLYNEDEGLSNIHDRGRSPRTCIFDDPESELYNRLVPECGGVSVSYWFFQSCPM